MILDICSAVGFKVECINSREEAGNAIGTISIQYFIIADAASEPEASEQVSSSNSYWALKVRFYFRFSDQNALLLTDQNAVLLKPSFH